MLAVECQPSRIEMRLRTGYLDRQASTLDDVRSLFARTFRPNGAVLGVAGRVDWPALRDFMGGLLGDWKAVPGIFDGSSQWHSVHAAES